MSEVDEATGLPAEIPPPRRVGRPKGSKNRITTLKLMAEEAAHERNQDRINYVIDLIISDAARGSFQAQKLIWQTVMSQGLPNEAKASEKVQINIGTTYHDLAKEKPVKQPDDIKIIPTIIENEEEEDGKGKQAES